MTTARNRYVKIAINSLEIENMQNFTFLRTKIDRSGDCSPEIKCHITLDGTAMISMN